MDSMSKWGLLPCSQRVNILSSESARSSRVFGCHFEVLSDLFISTKRQHPNEKHCCHPTWWTSPLPACPSPRIRGRTRSYTCARGAPLRSPPLRSTRRGPGGRRSPPRGRCCLSAQCCTRSCAALQWSSSGLAKGKKQLERPNRERIGRLDR